MKAITATAAKTQHKNKAVEKMMIKQTAFRSLCGLRKIRVHVLNLVAAALVLLGMSMTPAQADTITIGRGSGVVWEGMPFSGTLSGPIIYSNLGNVSFLAIGTGINTCSFSGATTATINGISGLKLAPGVILVPRLSVNGHFTRYNGDLATFGGTIGLPANAMFMDNGKNMHKYNTNIWCFSPEGNYTVDMPNYYSATVPRVINYSGSWVVITDGTQTTTDNISLPPFYFGSYTGYSLGNLYTQILPTTVGLRVSTLACTIATTTAINFGSIKRNDQSGTELAKLTYPLNTSCTQPTEMINANINVQFRAISGHYNSTPSWLALTQGGGYITGEIDNGVTGSGNCTGTSGIPFNSTQLKIGSITSSEISKSMTNQITWRLCSGGASLPIGAVDASAEMLVTFN